MSLTCLLVDNSPVTAGLHIITVVTLDRCHEIDPDMAVPVFDQCANDASHWQADFWLVSERPGKTDLYSAVRNSNPE